MSSTIWSGLDSGVIRYDLTYDADRPDLYGDQVNITFHLHAYLVAGKNFGFQLRWDAMWCMGNNWFSDLIKDNQPRYDWDIWRDCSCTVYTGNDYVSGVRLIMTSPNNSPSGWYDTGSDINISVPAKSIPKYWNDVNVYSPSGEQDYKSGYFDLYTSENDRWRYNLLNEDDDMTHSRGTWFQVQNIRPYYDYYELDRVTGYDSIPATGAYRKTFDAADEVMGIYMRYKSFTLTINPNGGSYDSSTSNKTVTQAYNTSYTLKYPTRTGYLFSHWSASRGSNFDENGSKIYVYNNAGTGAVTHTWLQSESTSGTNGDVLKIVTNGSASPRSRRVLSVFWNPSITYIFTNI